MSMSLKPGIRLYSAVCSSEFIAMKAPSEPVALTIGGLPPVSSSAERDGSVVAGHGGGSAIGKRYVDPAETVELLCTKPGDGRPALNGELLQRKEAKPLPASD